MAAMHGSEDLYLVVPTLNAARPLAANGTVAQARHLVISDGGSSDGTPAVAADLKATLVEGPAGRGPQLAAGADAAIGAGAGWLLFLHADTELEAGWQAEVQSFIADPDNRRRAGVFRFALDDDSAGARRLARGVAWRNRVLGLPYGDQGLLVAAEFYQALGGFRALALMEDVDLVRRIGRRRLHFFASRAITGAGRYRAGGYALRPLRNLSCLALFFLGLPSKWIVRIYG